jgi:hypothetical protein
VFAFTMRSARRVTAVDAVDLNAVGAGRRIALYHGGSVGSAASIVRPSRAAVTRTRSE